MASFGSAKPVYKDYVDSVSVIWQAKETKNLPKLIVVYGSSEFLLNKFCINIKKIWQGLTKTATSSCEAAALDRPRENREEPARFL